jgi:TRAP-type C4-dicarboxylate transport system permease small subunit
MAEIPIERKPRRALSPLLIILFVIVIIGLAWYWWTNKNTTTTTGSITSAVQVASVPVPVTYSPHFRRI